MKIFTPEICTKTIGSLSNYDGDAEGKVD